MNRQNILDKTLGIIAKLPNEKLAEIEHYATFLLKKHDEDILTNSIQSMAQKSETFNFLNQEEDLYTLDDLKVKFK
jgi:hypothetical protein